MSISNDIVSAKIYDNRADFDFEIVSTCYSQFYMVRFLALHPMESISLNSFVLLEHLVILLTSIRGSLMRPKWLKLASLAQKICTL